MPSVTTGKVLVTGANGFVAGWIIKLLLERGFCVRGTVRSPDKADAIRSALAADDEKLEFVVVKDITSPSAFDGALQGIDAIVHVASPVTIAADDPEELIQPAVQGTTGILHSASLPESTVRRAVVVSSLAAVVDTTRPTPAVFTEADWNEPDVATVRAQGAAAPQISKYRASKTLSERAAWDLHAAGARSGAIRWDLVTLCPPWVFGPMLGACSPADFTMSMKTWFSLVVKEEGEQPTWSRPSWVDVRDFAEAAVASLILPEAGGERFIISHEPFVWKQWVTLGRRLLGRSDPDARVPEDVTYDTIFDSSKSRRILGIKYHSMEETAAFMISNFKTNGWC